MKIFITGGAGYIGSHVVKMLGEQGHELLVFDNLSTGHERAVLYGNLVKGDLADTLLLQHTMQAFRADAVIHFAASIEVEESVRRPMKYYRNNVVNTQNLVEAMQFAAVENLLYSSSAAVYGIPSSVPVDETAELKPINPYGATKEITERILHDLAAAEDFHYIALRYFNVAGADPAGRLGQAYAKPTHLITRALKCAKGEAAKLSIYGTDYPTPDGTCIRDYIHIDDIASAHVMALEYLMETGRSDVMNCGYGRGFSVREVLSMVRKVTGVDLPVEQTGRRAGDPPALIADSMRLKERTGWTPRHDDLEFIIRTAWEWETGFERRLLAGRPAIHHLNE
ncbi:MAG TPA: UDP-glucose 4-epimerase GalE [Nitrospirota bacterium]|nr:UDP-glucose 4-epimerase GalE [Nitrospirota bacterium]